MIGRITAKCLLDDLPFLVDFTRPFLKHILSKYLLKI